MQQFFQKKFILVVLAIACFCAAFFFHPYLIQGKVPFPAQLLVSTYNPWKLTPDPAYPNGPPNKPIGFDNLRQFYPNRQFTKEELSKFRLPLWNPYIFSGTPYIGAFDTAIFYLPSMLFQSLPLIDAWSIMVILQPILSFLFMYLFLSSLERSKIGSLFGAFAYAFSGWMIVYWEESLILEHSFLWLPLTLYASTLIWQKAEKRGLFFLVFALVMSVTAGFFQMSIYVYIALFLWNVYQYVHKWNDPHAFSYFLYSIGGIILSFVIAGIQLIPTIEAYLQSPRGTMDGIFLFREYLAPLQHIITLIIPDFWGNPGTYNYFGGKAFYFEKTIFIGIIPLFFALYGFLKAKDEHAVFWKWFTGVTFLLGFALPTGWIPYILHIPVLASSYPTRIFALSLLGSCIVAAYGFDSFVKKQDAVVSRNIGYILGILLLVGWMIVFGAWLVLHRMTWIVALYDSPFSSIVRMFGSFHDVESISPWYIQVSLRNSIIPTIFFVASGITLLTIRFSKPIFYVGVFGISFASSFYFSYKYTYFSDRKFLYPESHIMNQLKEIGGYNRVWGYGNAFIEKNFPQYFHLYSTDGYGYLSPKRYGEFLSTIAHEGTISGSIRRSDTDIFEASEKEALGKGNPYRLRVMSLLGVKYILETKKGPDKDHKPLEDRFPATVFTLVYEDDTWRIWEYKDVLPRAFFASNILSFSEDEEVLKKLYDPATDLRHTIVVKGEEKKEEYHECMGEDKTEIIQYEPSQIVLSVEAPCDGAVFLSDTYYPGWIASVDGMSVPIIEADYAFRGVMVPKGSHRVEFMYKPLSFIFGGITTLVGIVILGIVLLYRKKGT